jgi:serine/threonine-protein kinase HipA
MAKDLVVEVWCFGIEIGKIGFNEDEQFSFFQYNPAFLSSNTHSRLFPLIFKRTEVVQVFRNYKGKAFHGLPPMIADSLPDLFGNVIFTKWIEATHPALHKISTLEQLTYLANRGMGALEFKPAQKLHKTTKVDLNEVVDILKKVMDNKASTSSHTLDHESLLTIFKIGTSAGGVRPKILVSENIKTGKIIPGDIEFSDAYRHYLVKLTLEDEKDIDYLKGKIEFAYYLTAKEAGIRMMDSKLIGEIHFATERFDRIEGRKIHILSTSGLTGWSHEDPTVSSYENVFELAVKLRIPQVEIDELFKRMVFNLTFFNVDDHLKNHSFCYDEINDEWHFAPAYDLTYPLSLHLTRTKTSRALSINGKRDKIGLTDLITLAHKYVVKSPEKTIQLVQSKKDFMAQSLLDLQIPEAIVNKMEQDFVVLA